MSPESKSLIGRLRIVAGQSVIKPPAIDIEAADRIEALEKELTGMRRKLTLAAKAASREDCEGPAAIPLPTELLNQ